MHRDNYLKILNFIPKLLAFVLSVDAYSLEISTTHPQVAAVLEQMHALHKSEGNQSGEIKDWKVTSVFGVNIDVHNFEPTIKDLKNLKKQKHLIAGPLTDQRWLLDAKEKGLLPKTHVILEFPGLGNDHFWLFPAGACSFEKQASKFLNEIGALTSESSPYCQWMTQKKEEIHTLLRKAKLKKVIVAHSALVPLFQAAGLEVLTLKQNDHEHETTPKTLKKIGSWLKEVQSGEHPSILVINEEGFHLPRMLEKAKGTMTLSWSPLKLRPRPIESLTLSLKELIHD